MPAAGDAVTRQFTTRNPTTKVQSDADSLPTAVLVRNGEDTAVTCTVTNVTTGVYRVTVTIPATYTDGDEVEFRVTATVASVTDNCILNIGEIESRSLAGTSGAYACTWTVDDGTDELQNATVSFWLNGVLKGTGTTDADGEVSMSLDAATYDVAITCDGYTFSNTTHTVSSTSSTWTKTFSMTEVSSPASTEPDTVTVRWRVKKADRTYCGAAEGTVYFQIIDGPGTAGFIYHGDNEDFDSETTDANGYVNFTNVPIPCTIAIKTGTSRKLKTFEIPSTATSPYDAGELVSHDA